MCHPSLNELALPIIRGLTLQQAVINEIFVLNIYYRGGQAMQYYDYTTSVVID